MTGWSPSWCVFRLETTKLSVSQVCDQRVQETTDDTMDLDVTTKQADLYNPADHPSERPLVGFKPAPRVRRRLRWRGYWVQFDTNPGDGWQHHGVSGGGGSVTVT